MNKEDKRKIIEVREEYSILTRYSDTFRNRLLKEYGVSIEYFEGNRIILKSEEEDMIKRLEIEMFREDSNIGIEEYLIEEDEIELLSKEEITDSNIIGTDKATIHLIQWNQEEIKKNIVYIIGRRESIIITKMSFIIGIKDLKVKIKEQAVLENR